MSEALRMAVVLADTMFPPGTTLFHAVERIAEAWMPTCLAEHGGLPRRGSWTAVADSGDGPGPLLYDEGPGVTGL